MNDRKKRRKMTINDIFNADWYRSIIYLTDIFDKGPGLRQLHYRWALIKDHDNIKQEYFISQLEEFFADETGIYKRLGFSNKLEREYADGIIVRDSVTSNNNLTNFLDRLTSPKYDLLSKSDEYDGVFRYKLTEHGKAECHRYMNHRLIDGAADERQEEITDKLMSLYSEDEIMKHVTIDKKRINGSINGVRLESLTFSL